MSGSGVVQQLAVADAMFQAVRDRGLLGRNQVPTNLTELAALMGDPELSSPDLPLGRAIAAFEAHLHAVLQLPGWSFYRDLLPLICTWASEKPWVSRMLTLLRQGQAKSVTLTHAQCRCLNANAFLLNIRCPKRSDLGPAPGVTSTGAQQEEEADEETFPQHSWGRVFGHRYEGEVAVTKVLCLLAYFYHASITSTAAEDSNIVVERLQDRSTRDFTTWASSTALIRASAVNLHSGTMEAPPSHAFVDFANRFVGYRGIIPSMTQEEVLWCMAPDAQPSSLLCEVMLDTEAVVVRNITRVSQYSGYLHRCRWRGFWDAPAALAPLEALPHSPTFDVLVMDAQVVRDSQEQFTSAGLTRDLVKAWLCFGACGTGQSSGGDGTGAGVDGSGAGGGGSAGGANGGRDSGGGDGSGNRAVGCDDDGGDGRSGGGGGGNGGGDGDVRDSTGTHTHTCGDDAGPSSFCYRISTGNWGCGAFGGNKVLKFLQQVCAVTEVNATRAAASQKQHLQQPLQQQQQEHGNAAAEMDATGVAAGQLQQRQQQHGGAAAEMDTTGVAASQPLAPQQPHHLQLDFSTFGDQEQLAELQSLLQALERAHATVGQVCNLAVEFGATRGGRPGRLIGDAGGSERAFLQWLLARLGDCAIAAL